MYIYPTQRYYVGAEQYTRRQWFLLIIQPRTYERKAEPFKAIVRKVALRQLGHWMVGTARIYNHSIGVSGSYGGDGFPRHVPDEVYDRAQVLLPDYLVKAWREGGGWTSAGSEAQAMREWAITNLEILTK